MKWGKKELIAINASMGREIELLREQLKEKKEEIIDLKKQIKYTQNALIAKESPDAFHYQREAEEAANKDKKLTPEEKEKQDEYTKVVSDYFNEIEAPLFRDADDMIRQLLPIVDMPGLSTSSLHENEES